MSGVVVDFWYREQAIDALMELDNIITQRGCALIMLRLAWHEAATYNAEKKSGGPDGSIRYGLAYSHPINDGLKNAINICAEVKSKYDKISYADLYQLAGVAAVKVAGGPIIPFYPGRKDRSLTSMYGWLLPSPAGDAAHLRKVFYRMGLSDRDIVVISGVPAALVRADQDRSDYEGPSTQEPFKFDNSYFMELVRGETAGLLKRPTDIALMNDPGFRRLVELYARNRDAFFKDYAESHQKFSEFGFVPNSPHSVNIVRYVYRPCTNIATKSYNWWLIGGTVAAVALVLLCRA